MRIITQLDDIEPKESVQIDYADASKGSYSMDLKKNSYLHVWGAKDGIESLNPTRRKLTQMDLSLLVKEHRRIANEDIIHGKPCPLSKVEVDGKLVFEPKMLEYARKNATQIELSGIHPKKEVCVSYAKPIYTEWQMNAVKNTFVEIRPEKDGIVHHNAGTITPKRLETFLKEQVEIANNVLKDTGNVCPIDTIHVDGKLVFEQKMLKYGKNKAEDIQKTKSKEAEIQKPKTQKKGIHRNASSKSFER